MMDDAAIECSIGAVSGWVGANTKTALEMKLFLRKTVDEILDRVDLPDPITKDTVITGTGVETYDLPTDYRRLTYDELAIYESAPVERMGIPITSNGQWTYLKDRGSAASNRYYRLSGDEEAGFDISFYRPLESSASVTVSYVSKNWTRISGTDKSIWNDDNDILLLPETLTRLGVVWRFRQKKGMTYSAIQSEYEIRLSRAINNARRKRKFEMGGQNIDTHPMRVPVPDFIPGA
jgi:hypothetical protein